MSEISLNETSNISNITANTVQLIPSIEELTSVGIERPEYLLAAGAVAGALVVAQAIHNRFPEQSGIKAKASQHIEAAAENKPVSYVRRHVASTLLLSGGSVLFADAAQPYYETTKTRDDAATIIVVDASTSMTRALDVEGKSRFEATLEALKDLEYDGKLGVVMAADGAKPALPLSEKTEWQNDITKLPTVVGPNGDDISRGIDLANGLLGQGRKNEIIVISDGTVQIDSESAKLAQKLEKAGRSISVVMPGTANGSYQYSGASKPVKVGVQTDAFAEYTAEPVSVDTVDELRQSIDTAISTATDEKHKEPIEWPGKLGMLLIGAGVAITYGKTVTKRQG